MRRPSRALADAPTAHPDAVAGVLAVRVDGETFSIGSLPAGAYSICAVNLEDFVTLKDPVYRAHLRTMARRLLLTRGTSASLDLTLVDVRR